MQRTILLHLSNKTKAQDLFMSLSPSLSLLDRFAFLPQNNSFSPPKTLNEKKFLRLWRLVIVEGNAVLSRRRWAWQALRKDAESQDKRGCWHSRAPFVWTLEFLISSRWESWGASCLPFFFRFSVSRTWECGPSAHLRPLIKVPAIILRERRCHSSRPSPRGCQCSGGTPQSNSWREKSVPFCVASVVSQSQRRRKASDQSPPLSSPRLPECLKVYSSSWPCHVTSPNTWECAPTKADCLRLEARDKTMPSARYRHGPKQWEPQGQLALMNARLFSHRVSLLRFFRETSSRWMGVTSWRASLFMNGAMFTREWRASVPLNGLSWRLCRLREILRRSSFVSSLHSLYWINSFLDFFAD